MLLSSQSAVLEKVLDKIKSIEPFAKVQNALFMNVNKWQLMSEKPTFAKGSIDWTVGESIDWTVGDRHLISNTMLLLEHFHRLALWCNTLQKWSYWPSVDMFHLFNLTIDDETERDEIHNQLALASSYLGYQAWLAWDKWFRWLLVQEYATKAYPHLPDPFAPLIRMYERGGTYYTQHGFVYVGRIGAKLVDRTREDYRNESFVSSLDDATLNALDK